MADQGLTNKDKVCQFFASNAGLHFRSADVAAALGLDGRSVGQQLARLWRAGFVEKVQTTPYATWRMKLQTYPGRNLHGPAAPKPASPTPHTPAKKSTRGSRTLEEVRNDSGHCAMGSPLVQGWREEENEEGDEESVDQESSSVEACSVRVPASNSVSSKPPSVTTKRTMSAQDNILAQRSPQEAPMKRKLGRPPGSKSKPSTTVQSRQEGTITIKTSSTSGSRKRTTATAVKRKVGAESNNTDQLLKKKVKKTMLQPTVQGCRDRSSTDDESSPQKLVGTEVKRKVRADSKNADKGLKGKVKKTRSQFTDREDFSSRSDTDFELSYQVPNKTRLMPTTVSSQRASATAVKKNPNKLGLKVKKTMSQSTVKEGKSSTSDTDSLQNKTRIMPATLAPSLNKPAGNMETKLINFIQEAQGMLVMTGDDVAKALGSKPKETHRLLLHMQRTGQVRKVCDRPTRWMMLGGGQGRDARKGQVQLRTTAQSVTKQQVASTQAFRNLHTSTASSTQTSRNLHVDMATEGESSRTGHIVAAWSGCDQDGKKPALPISSCEEEEEIASTSAKESTKFGRCLSTAEEDVDVSSASEDQDSDFLEEEGFCTNGNQSSPALSVPSKKQSVTGNQKSQVTTTLRRSLSPCGRKRDNVGRLLAQAIKSAVSPLNMAGGKKMTLNTRDVNRTEDSSTVVGQAVLSDDEEAVASPDRGAGQAVSSLAGPVEQSSWTQPKALYASDKRETLKQEESEFQGSCGQGEAAMNEAWTQPKALYSSDKRETQKEEEKEAQGSGGHEEATVDEAGYRDGLKVSQVSRNQGSVARVTPQGSRQVATSACPSNTLVQQGHPIVQLNELCQRNRLRICFQDISVTGPAHRPRVQLAAVVGERTFQAQASSKKAARRKAAQDALQALYQEGYK
ncbi:Hypp9176 [Branchiostoma lanceolatum]|uniref:Hypp9176 protein n=1 Tax=Branchiostoma lanceolatum TaxID=7740 RepID=A0A8J9ZC85_BRALA|nr:Hypp9176 [Branchiostoma lanceolatum]